MRVHECVTSGPWFYLFSYVLFCVRACVDMVWILNQWSVLWVYYIFLFHFHFCFFSVYSHLGRHGMVAGHAPQVLPYIYVDRVSWGQRLQVKGHGGVSSTFKTKPGVRPQVGPLVCKFIVHTSLSTQQASWGYIDVTSVPGSSLQLSYIKWEMADINSATCTTAYKLLVPLQLSLYTRCLVPSLLEVQ